MTSPITGHGPGSNGQQPINLILAKGHQLIPLRARVVSNQPITRGEKVGDGNTEMNANSRCMLQVKKRGGSGHPANAQPWPVPR